jgi:hypothetical protein
MLIDGTEGTNWSVLDVSLAEVIQAAREGCTLSKYFLGDFDLQDFNSTRNIELCVNIPSYWGNPNILRIHSFGWWNKAGKCLQRRVCGEFDLCTTSSEPHFIYA